MADNLKYEYKGDNYSLSQLAKLSGLHVTTIESRINKSGWTVAEAVETPPGKSRDPEERRLNEQITEMGERMTYGMLRAFFAKHTEAEFEAMIGRMIEESPRQFVKDVLLPALKEFGAKHTESNRGSTQNVLINLPGFRGAIDSDSN